MGEIQIEGSLIEAKIDFIQCSLAKSPVDRKDPFLYHKTTHRKVYEKHQIEANPESFSVLLWNEQEELTEFTLGNLVVEKDGNFYTPPIQCGLLAGTFRQHLLDRGKIEERILYKNELSHFDRIWFVNGVRGWVEVKMNR